MRTAPRLTLAIFFLLSIVSLHAASLAGVTLPDNIHVAGKSLVLNGLGIRTKFMVKVYVAGLYLERKSSDPSAIISADAPKQIVMRFVRGASKSQMTGAFDESLKDNAPNAERTMKADIERLFGGFEDVKQGDQMVFTYLPGMGTTLTVNGKDKVTIAAPAFGPVLFSLWLGPRAPDTHLKMGMLGQ